jgi:hypothetical protein
MPAAGRHRQTRARRRADGIPRSRSGDAMPRPAPPLRRCPARAPAPVPSRVHSPAHWSSDTISSERRFIMAARIRVFTVPSGTPSSSPPGPREVEPAAFAAAPRPPPAPRPVLAWSLRLQGEKDLRIDRVEAPRRQHVDRHVTGDGRQPRRHGSSSRVVGRSVPPCAHEAPAPLPLLHRDRGGSRGSARTPDAGTSARSRRPRRDHPTLARHEQ